VGDAAGVEDRHARARRPGTGPGAREATTPRRGNYPGADQHGLSRPDSSRCQNDRRIHLRGRPATK
jgi:hypothetical protein